MTAARSVEAASHFQKLSMNRNPGGLVTYLQVATAQATALANEGAKWASALKNDASVQQ